MRFVMLYDSAVIASTVPSVAASSLALIPVILIFESTDTLKRMIIPPYFSFGL